MSVKRLILAATVLGFPFYAFAQDWVEFVDTTDRFSVFFPGEPDVREGSYPSEYRVEFPARVYSYEDGDSRYSVTVVDYSNAREIHAARTNKTEADDGSLYWAVDVLGSIAYAAWNIRKRGGEVTHDAWHYIQRVEGHQLQITNDDGSRTFAGIYLHEMRLYISEATVPPGALPPVLFQQSLGLLDENGDTFNYEYIHTPRLRIGGG